VLEVRQADPRRGGGGGGDVTFEHGAEDYEHVWPPYGVQIAEADARTASQRTAHELAALRSDLVMVLATVQEINRRMAVVEHRLLNQEGEL
jgi:hypothetical protein